jgi:hypothetical protein
MRRFAVALTAGDAQAIARMWEVPALVLSDAGVHAVASLNQVESFFAGAKEQYTARGIDEAIPEIESVDWMTDRLVSTRVRWPYLDKAGLEIGEESSTYMLRRNDAGELKLQVIAMHGEKKH